MSSRRMPVAAPNQPYRRDMTSLWLNRRLVLQASRRRLGGLLCVFAVAGLTADSPPVRADWPMFGQNLQNTATTSEGTISAKNAGQLKKKWAFTTEGDVSARAAVVNGVAYFP